MVRARALNRGKLVVLDGTDGVGKRTQVELLVTRLKREGIPVRTLDFPQYNTNFFGAFIKRCLAGEFGDFIALDPHLASILYAADRFESKHTLVEWLDEGCVVVLDRYVSANQMHQGGKIESPRERARFLAWLDHLEHEALAIPRPDLVLYLHLPVRLSLALLAERARGTRAQRALDLAEQNRRHLEDTRKTAIGFLRKQPEWHKVTCFDRAGILPREKIHEAVYDAVQAIL